MAKFKVGDRVRIKEKLICGCRYGSLYFPYGCEKYCGKEYTIIDIDIYGNYIFQGIDNAVFNDAMVAPSTENTVHITVSGNTVGAEIVTTTPQAQSEVDTLIKAERDRIYNEVQSYLRRNQMSKHIPCNMDWCKHNIDRYCCANNPPIMEWEGGAKRNELKKPVCATYEDGETESE